MNTLYYSSIQDPETVSVLVTAIFIEKPLDLQYSKKAERVALKTDRGILRGSATISRYLADNHKIAGSQQQQRLQVSQWFQFYDSQVHHLLRQLRANITGVDINQAKYSYCLEQIHKVFKIFDDYLSKRTFFIGDSVTVFDICLCANLDLLFRLTITEQLRKNYKNLARWFIFVRNLQPFHIQMGDLELCGKQPFGIQFKEQINEEKALQKERELDINKFKKAIVISDDLEKPKIIDSLLNNLAQDYWSIWKIHYIKDVVEAKDEKQAVNLAATLLKKVEGLKQNAFGSWGVYQGEEGFQIRGVMMWKGTEVCEQWKKHPAYAYLIMVKLDPRKQRQVIHQYWLKQQNAEGLALRDSNYLL